MPSGWAFDKAGRGYRLELAVFGRSGKGYDIADVGHADYKEYHAF